MCGEAFGSTLFLRSRDKQYAWLHDTSHVLRKQQDDEKQISEVSAPSKGWSITLSANSGTTS